MALGMALGILAAGSASADEKLAFEVTVLRASPDDRGVDPKAERFHRILGGKVRYESLQVVESKRRQLAPGETGSVRLPSGKTFQFRPIDQGDQGVLVAVDMEKAAQGDFRMRKGKPLFFGYPHEDGQLVVILEPR